MSSSAKTPFTTSPQRAPPHQHSQQPGSPHRAEAVGEAPVTFLRMKGLKGTSKVLVAAKHNHREILAELGGVQSGIDPSKSRLNRVLRGQSTAAGVAKEARDLMSAAGVEKLRKDALRGVEVVFSLPTESSVDANAFFEDAVQWAEQWFAVPILSAVVHNDEAAPHCHVILLPLVDGAMRGSALMGNRSKLFRMQADFHTKVGKNYGFGRQAAAPSFSAALRSQAMAAAFDMLEANSGIQPAVLRVLLGPHFRDPDPLLSALGIAVPSISPKSKPQPSFVAIMTRPCKDERKVAPHRNPIGLTDETPLRSDQTLSCVGVVDLATADQTGLEQYLAAEVMANAAVVTKAEGTMHAIQREATARNDEHLTEKPAVSNGIPANHINRGGHVSQIMHRQAEKEFQAKLRASSVANKRRDRVSLKPCLCWRRPLATARKSRRPTSVPRTCKHLGKSPPWAREKSLESHFISCPRLHGSTFKRDVKCRRFFNARVMERQKSQCPQASASCIGNLVRGPPERAAYVDICRKASFVVCQPYYSNGLCHHSLSTTRQQL